MSDLAADLTPTYLEGHGFESVPKSVAYGYTASGYGFVQDMPYAYIHEFTRTSMAGKIRRFKGGYTSFWDKISKSLAVKVLCNTEVLKVRRNALGVRIVVKNVNGNSEVMEFDKIIISGAFPFRNRKTYRSPVSNPTGLSTCVHLVFFFFLFLVALSARVMTWMESECYIPSLILFLCSTGLIFFFFLVQKMKVKSWI